MVGARHTWFHPGSATKVLRGHWEALLSGPHLWLPRHQLAATQRPRAEGAVRQTAGETAPLSSLHTSENHFKISSERNYDGGRGYHLESLLSARNRTSGITHRIYPKGQQPPEAHASSSCHRMGN